MHYSPGKEKEGGRERQRRRVTEGMGKEEWVRDYRGRG